MGKPGEDGKVMPCWGFADHGRTKGKVPSPREAIPEEEEKPCSDSELGLEL
jgi:hypothetical protein